MPFHPEGSGYMSRVPPIIKCYVRLEIFNSGLDENGKLGAFTRLAYNMTF